MYEKILDEQPYRLVFATISGAHLYGFDSVDSDVDLRGVHVLPLAEVAGLDLGPETLQDMSLRDGVEIDLVTHDLLKFCRLLLRPNGYVAEQLLSPLVVVTSETQGPEKTGIHLMRTGEVVADLRLVGAGIPYVPELIAAKREAEHGKLVGIVTLQQLSADVERLRTELSDAASSSSLPDRPTAKPDLHRIILRERVR